MKYGTIVPQITKSRQATYELPSRGIGCVSDKIWEGIMKISEVIGNKGNAVTTVTPSTSIRTAVGILKVERIGALLVMENGAILGILSERDVVRALVDHEARTLDLRVSDLMTRNLHTCKSDDKLTDVMKQMTQRRIRHLPVIEDGELKGIVSIGDAVKNRLEELEMETNVLRDAYTAAM